MNQTVSVPRKIARAIFIGLGVAFLILIVALLLDTDTTSSVIDAVRERNWANRIFRETVQGAGLWLLIAAVFLSASQFVKTARIWGLLGLTLVNLWFVLAAWDGTKGIILVPPLILSLICLAVEDYRTVLNFRRGHA